MNLRCILNVRGCNASGKTTTVREFINTFESPHVEMLGSSVITVCSQDVIVLGRYDKKNGGCDGYKGKDQVISTIEAAIRTKRPRVIIYEGMIYSKTCKMAVDVQEKITKYGYGLRIIYLHRSFESILDLLEKRNGGSDYNPLNIYRTYEAVQRAYEKLKAANFCIRKIEVENYGIDDMKAIIPKSISDIPYRGKGGMKVEMPHRL